MVTGGGALSHPWLKKNPILSMWLGGANALAGAARGRVRSTAKGSAAMATRQAAGAVVNGWLALFAALKPQRKKRR